MQASLELTLPAAPIPPMDMLGLPDLHAIGRPRSVVMANWSQSKQVQLASRFSTIARIAITSIALSSWLNCLGQTSRSA